MNRLFLTLAFITLVYGVKAQGNASGTLTLENWKPQYANAQQAVPTINSLSLRYTFEPAETYCKVTTSIQWYLGNEVRYQGKTFTTPTVSSDNIALFSLLELELQAHAKADDNRLGDVVFTIRETPSAGGAWGKSETQNVPWGKLFFNTKASAAKKIVEERLKVYSLRIRKITFNGEASFRQESYDACMEKANTVSEQGNNREAIRWLSHAIDLNPTAAEPRRQRKIIQQQLGAFADLEQQGDQFFRRGQYLLAYNAYQQAEELMPGQLQNPKRLREIENRMAQFKQLDMQANQLLQVGSSLQDYLSARERFNAAAEFLPERSNYIDEQILGINRFLEDNYQDLMREGDELRGQGQLPMAVQRYYEAQQIFPNKSASQNAIRATENEVVQQIKNTYNADIEQAEQAYAIALDNAAKVIYESSERCYLQQAEYQKCMLAYFEQQKKDADQEMRGMLYGERYEVNAMGCRSVTCPLESEANPTATTLLASAKRKHQLFQQFERESFATFRNRFIEKALAKDDCFAEAYYFKSQFAKSSMEEMQLLDKALACKPNYSEAKQRKENINADFSREFFEKIAQGDLIYLEKALENGFLNQVGEFQGYNITEYAVVENQMPVLDFFLSNAKNLPLNATTNPNELAYLAIEKGYEDVLRYLLFQRKANPDAKPVGKDSMLFAALAQQNDGVLTLLLEANANVAQTNAKGNTPLQEALSQQNESAFQLLLAKYRKEQLTPQMLQTALQKGMQQASIALLNKGVSETEALPNGSLPLFFATRQGAGLVVRAAIENGYAMDTQNEAKNSLLMHAILNNRAEVAKYLINRGALLSVKNNTNESALTLSVQQRMQNTALLLLEKGADIGELLMVATQKNERFRTDAMLALGEYAINTASIDLVKEVIALNLEAGFYQLPSQITLIETAAKKNQSNTVLLFAEAAPKAKTPREGLTALHLAARYELGAVVEPLAKIIEVNSRDLKQDTPLHQAIRMNSANLVKKLMNAGANPKLKNAQNWNAKKLANKLGYKHLKSLL